MKEWQLDVLRDIQSVATPFLDKLAEIVTFFGEETVVVCIVALFYYVLNKEFGKKLIYIVLTSGMLNGIVKNFVKAPRPIGEPGIRSVRTQTATGYSFPSGHTQNAATIYPAIVRYSKRRWPYVLAGVLIALIALSRLYLGVHYPIDVVIGAALGLLVCFLGSFLYDRVKTERLFGITALIMIPFAVIFAIINNPLFDDFFKMFGMFIGATLALLWEGRAINFASDVVWWKKLLRFVIGLGLIVAAQQGLKAVFPNVFYFHALRYFIMAFIGLGVWPFIFQKLRL